MKKFLSLGLIVCSLLAFSGCQEAEDLKNEAVGSYENVQHGVTEVKNDIDNTVNAVSDTVDNVNKTVDDIKNTAEGVKEGAENLKNLLPE